LLVLPHPPDTRLEALEQQISDSGQTAGSKAQVVQRDGVIAELHRQLAEQLQFWLSKECRAVSSILSRLIKLKNRKWFKSEALSTKKSTPFSFAQRTEAELNSCG